MPFHKTTQQTEINIILRPERNAVSYLIPQQLMFVNEIILSADK